VASIEMLPTKKHPDTPEAKTRSLSNPRKSLYHLSTYSLNSLCSLLQLASKTLTPSPPARGYTKPLTCISHARSWPKAREYRHVHRTQNYHCKIMN